MGGTAKGILCGRNLVLLFAMVGLGLQLLGFHNETTRRTVADQVGMDFDVNLVVDEVYELGSELGFKLGDRVVAVDGQTVASFQDYDRVINQHTAESTTVLTIRSVSGTWDTPPLLVGTRPVGVSVYLRNLVALAFLAIGTLVGVLRTDDKVSRLYFLAGLSLGLYFSLLKTSSVGLTYIYIAALSLAPGLVLHLFLSFPKERQIAKAPWWLLLYLPSLILAGFATMAYYQAVQAGLGKWGSPWYGTLTNRIGYYYLALSAVVGLASTAFVYARIPHSILRRQLQWIMWGLVCAVVVAAVDVMLTLHGLHTPEIEGLELLGMLPLPVAIAFAIQRYRLLDIDLMLHRSMVYGLLTALLAAVYLLLVSILSRALGAATDSGSYTLAVFIAAVIIGILANPARTRIQAIIDRIFFRRQVDYRRTLVRWSEELGTSIRFADLARLLLDEVPRQLMLEGAWLLILDEQETFLTPLANPTDPDTAETRLVGSAPTTELPPSAGRLRVDTGEATKLTIPAYAAFASRLSQSGSTLLSGSEQSGGSVPQTSDLPLAWEEAGVRVAIPLISREKLVGVYLLGPKLSGDIYPRGELDLLRTLANHAAIGIMNARLYEEVHALSRELEERVREQTLELRDFVSVVYHEMRSPIAAIQGYTELLRNEKTGSLTSKQARFLGNLSRSNRRVMDLVDDLADISQIDDGRLALHLEPLDLEGLVEETVGASASAIEEKGHRVEISLDPDMPTVLGDPQRVAQILTNLVTNACRYTPAGGRITIASSLVNAMAELTVADTGIGIHKEDQNRIFERFYRSNDPLVQEQPGTGLGLAITKSLVELHNGYLWVKSEPGHGSTFGFALPLTQNDSR
jgi:signal transduction histidine kinase